MSEVIIKRASYDYETLKPLVFELIDTLNRDLIRKNSRVLIKPNFLAPAPPEKTLITHPMIIRATVEYVLQKEAHPQISDSPALGRSFDRVLLESGIKDALRDLNVEYKEFRESEIIDTGPPFNKIEISADALHADILINLPKLKTHSQMLLTLGVKNLFGCVVGLKKPEWHLRTGIDRNMFARLLVQIFKAVSPSMTILDGILAMEGHGPGKSGSPRYLGLLMASSDTVALDITVCKMLGIDPDRLLTNKIAREMNLLDTPIKVSGEFTEIHNFRLPEITPLIFGPEKFHGFMRRHLVQRPVSDKSLCVMCGECWRYCPAQAISEDKKKILFDYEACIRCYCCIEICPYGALSAQETTLGKIVRKMIIKRNN